MTMREIQDLTLQIERGLAGIERRFEQRATMAEQWVPPKAAFALRATAMPLAPIEVPGVPGNASTYPRMQEVIGNFSGGGRATAHIPVHLGMWRPILRGAKTEERRENQGYRVELYRDGLIEFLVAVEDGDGLLVFAEWVMGLVCNALIAIDRTRLAAGSATVEYGLELAIVTQHRDRPVAGYGHSRGRWGPIQPPGVVLPRYSVGDRGAFEKLLDLIQRDFWNATGHDLKDDELLKVDFEPHLK